MKSIESEYIREIHYKDAKSLLSAISYGGELYDSFSGDFIYRGHYSDKFLLIPSALREGALDRFEPEHDNGDKYLAKVYQLEIAQIWGEYQLLQRYYELCDRNNLNVPNSIRLRDSVIKSYDVESLFQREDWLPRDLWEIAALAQHHGIPTRLLDWTSNIKTALYFSVVDYIKLPSIFERIERQKLLLEKRSKKEEDYCEIWALDTKVIVGSESTLPLKIIRPPYRGNPNLAAQEGVFTLWTVTKPVTSGKKFSIEKTLIDKTPLDSLLVNRLKELKVIERPFMYRISCPRKEAVEIYSYLEKEGHTAAKLFPGYDGIVRSMKESKQFNDLSHQ